MPILHLRCLTDETVTTQLVERLQAIEGVSDIVQSAAPPLHVVRLVDEPEGHAHNRLLETQPYSACVLAVDVADAHTARRVRAVTDGFAQLAEAEVESETDDDPLWTASNRVH